MWVSGVKYEQFRQLKVKKQIKMKVREVEICENVENPLLVCTVDDQISMMIYVNLNVV